MLIGAQLHTHLGCGKAGRVLFHTRFGGRSSGIVNGTTATIDGVDERALTVRLESPHQHDDGRVGVVEAGFVEGTRPDGSPNLSHAWARTVDGAQGGTWKAAHLLGIQALDRYRGYVGQSRSLSPTHTWNTSLVPVVDRGGVPADQRDPDEHVLAALTRVPDTTPAASSDPYVVDRELRSLKHRLCSCDAPAGPGDVHPVLDQVAAGALDHSGGNGPTGGQGLPVVQVGGLVGEAAGTVVGLLALVGEPGRRGSAPDPGGDVAGLALEDGHRFPFTEIDANRAWLAVVCFADGLVGWFQRLCLTGALAVAEPKTLRWQLWHTPARFVCRARQRVVRILEGWPGTGALLVAYGTSYS